MRKDIDSGPQLEIAQTMEALRAENAMLRMRLARAEAVLDGERNACEHRGEADAEREKLLQLIQHSSDFVGVADLEGRLTFLNPAGRRMIGLGEQESIGQVHIADYVAPDSRRLLEETVVPSVLERGQWEGEMRLRNLRTGAVMDVARSTFLIRHPETGQPLGLATVTRDITERKATERALRQSEERLALVLLAGEIGFWDWDVASGRVVFGGQWAPMLGYEVEELEPDYRTWERLVHPEDLQRVIGVLQEHLCGRAPFYECEHRLRHKDGSWRWILTRGRVVERDAEGRALRALGTHTDVTARKVAEMALERAAERAAVAQRAARAFLFEFRPSTGKAFRTSMFEEVFGYRPGEVDGSREGWRTIIHPEDVALFDCSIDAALANGTAYSLEYRVRHKAGHYLWVADQGQLIRGPHGAVDRLVGMVRDITEQKLAEQALREQTMLFQAITQATPDLIFAKDRESRLLVANPATLAVIGKPASEVLGHSELDYHDDPRQAAAIIANDRRIMELGRTEVVEEAFTTPGGGPRAFLSTKSPLRNEAGEVIGIVGITRDISDLKRANDALREAKEQAEAANRAKDAFLAALSHELRTPLNPVLLLAGEMEKNPELSPWLRADFALIRRNIELEARLIDDLLDLTRISRGKLQLELRALDAHALLGQVMDILRGSIEGKQISVALELAAANPWVRGDAVRLQQVFWNVVKNAVKFTPAGGSVVVRTRNGEGGQLLLDIVDTGMGIEPEEMGHIFKAFGQGEHASSRRFGGLGLGLAICELLVNLHSGRIWAESDGRGKGSTFHIELPGTEPEGAAAPQTAVAGATAAAVPVRAGGPLRILLVEDHEATRAILARLLTRRSYQVTTAPSAAAAREWAKARSFDLLLSDLGLPDGDGRVLMTELRARYGLRGIALSGYGMECDVQHSLEAGFDAHLTKPVDMEALERAIAAVCR